MRILTRPFHRWWCTSEDWWMVSRRLIWWRPCRSLVLSGKKRIYRIHDKTSVSYV